jgi:hypothetical protein
LRASRLGEPAGSVSIARDDVDGVPALVEFGYNFTNESGKKRHIAFDVRIDSTRCHFGGVRYWFRCPLVTKGVLCGNRCRCVYATPDGTCFGCRECNRLTYESRRRHRDWLWEVLLKHERWLNVSKKYRKPRGIKACQRRLRRLLLVSFRIQRSIPRMNQDPAIRQAKSILQKWHR